MRTCTKNWMTAAAVLAAVLMAARPALALIDADADGFPQASDCNDGNGQVWGAPGEALNLQFAADKRTITWSPPSALGGTVSSVRYDTLRSTSPSNFASMPASQCQDPEGLSTSSNDPAAPAPGTAFYYLIRAKNDCGDATLGSRTGGTPRVGIACDCAVLCNDGLACTRDHCNDGVCAHDPIAPVIQSPPASAAACGGDATLFSVRATGQGTLHYQWKKGTTNVGTDSATLTLSAAIADDGAQISCAVTDACTTASSPPATLTVFSSAASCSGGGSGLEAPNGASDDGIVRSKMVTMKGSRVNICRGEAPPSDPLGGVYRFSGEFYVEIVDFAIEGRGFDFEWRRKYRNREGRLTPMGQGWDFSYNRSVALDGLGNLIVADGNSRRDTYAMGTSGCWTSPGFFRDACPQSDGTIVLTFPNLTTWTFAKLDGSPAAGKLTRIQDSNSNAMTFAYDSAGKLATITDTLGRPITISYNTDGFISAVTDFGGRQVTYGYASALDAEGSPGDLRTVTSPSVTGTPDGNDFPAGKTTTYGYTKGMPQPSLNHNLVTITDPTGALVLRNVYAPEVDPASPRFDRMDRQILPNGSIDYVYVALTPGPTDPSVTKTIVRDRAGNVSEQSFDTAHRLTKLVEYTGRAPNASLPTDDTTNRPTGQLRPTDPPSFTTQFSWSADSLLTSAVSPEGNSLTCSYDSSNANMRQRVNLLEATLTAGARGGDQSAITESFTYATAFASEPCFGGGCGEGPVFAKVPRNILKSYLERSSSSSYKKHQGQMGNLQSNPMYRWSTHQDGLGHTWTQDVDAATGNILSLTAPPVFTGTGGTLQLISESWEYNAFGQVIRHTDPAGRKDRYDYYTSGPQKGYLQGVTVDETGAALFTITARDQYGNMTARTDPRGNTETFTYNQLDQPVLHVARPLGDVRTSIDYDAADRVVGVDVKNVDANGVVETNALTSTFHYYDALGRLVKTRLEPDTVAIDTEYVYDANDHVTLERRPEAVNGHQPANVVRSVYDERDRLFRKTVAESDPQASTTQWDYDGNGNLVAVREGLESSPRVTLHAWDGFDRPRQTTAMDGTVTVSHFDADGNRTYERTDGQLVDGESATSVRLAETTFTYDEIERLVQVDEAAFDTTTQNPLYDEFATTKRFYDLASRIVRIEDDNGNGTNTAYDTAGRIASTTDAKGNVRAFAYDGNSNVIHVTETDVSDLATSPPQDFVTTLTYDNLDRRTSTTDSAGNIEQDFYDSRNNPTLHIDARGNQTRFVYDGANRLIQTARTMTDTGDGSGATTFVLDATRSHDADSRLVGATDDNGNTTLYQYDPLDRRHTTIYPDGTSESMSYDVHGNPVQIVDPNGTVTTATFDLANRLVTRSIARAPGVLGTTAELWKYDGLSRVVFASNDVAVVTRQYDSLSDVTQETQTVGAAPARTLTSAYDGAGQLTSMTYPSNINVVATRDAIGNVKTLTTSGPNVCAGGPTPGVLCANDSVCGLEGHCQPLAAAPITFDYAGRDRLVRRQCCKASPNEELDVEYDAARRVSRTTHKKMIPVTVPDDRAYTWDPAYNKLTRTQLSPSGMGGNATFTYDSASRMLHSATTLPGLPPAPVDYSLDGVGNRVLVAGGLDGGAYTMSPALPDPADREVNQYTTTPFDGTRDYDANGNTLRRNGQITHADFDYKNRLVQVPTSGGTHTFGYDAMGRGVAVDCRIPFFAGDELIEERDCSGNLAKAYVYGPGGDVVIAVADVNGDGRLDRSAYHADDLGNVVAVTNGNGDVLESYSYDDYGAPHVFNAAGSPIAQSAIGNVVMFGGRRYDSATGLYDFETRHYDPRAGRFISRDALGAWGDAGNLGNANAYVNNNPQSLTDPTGMSEQPRSYLYTKFENGDIPDQEQFRDVLDSLFENGKIPTQDDFKDMIDSALNLSDDHKLLGLKTYDPIKEYTAGDTRGDKPTQAQFGSLIDSMVNKISDRYLLGLKQYNPTKEYLAGDTVVYGSAVFGGGTPTGGSGGAMAKGKVKFFNETKGFGFKSAPPHRPCTPILTWGNGLPLRTAGGISGPHDNGAGGDGGGPLNNEYSCVGWTSSNGTHMITCCEFWPSGYYSCSSGRDLFYGME